MATDDSIQKVIDSYQNTNEQSKKIYSFDITSKKGECSIPKNVHVRFYKCEFDSFSSEGDSNFYFENCTFNEKASAFNITKSTFKINTCTFKSKVVFSDSYGYVIGTTISKNLSANNNSYIISRRNIYSSKDDDCIITDTSSKVESYLDTFSNDSKFVFNLNNSSVINCYNPTFNSIKNDFVLLDNGSALTILNPGGNISVSNSFGSIGKRSKVYISNAKLLKSSLKGFTLKDYSKLKLYNVETITADSYFLNTQNSTVDINTTNLITTNSSNYAVEAISSKILYNNVNIFKNQQGGLHNIADSEILFTYNINDYKENQAASNKNIPQLFCKNEVVKSGSNTTNLQSNKVCISNAKILQSQDGTTLDLSKTYLFLENIETLTAASSTIKLADYSTGSIDNVQYIKGTNNTVLITNNSKLVAQNLKNITNSGSTCACLVEVNSTLSISNANTIEGYSEQGIVVRNLSSFTGNNIKAIKSNSKDAILLQNQSNLCLNNIDEIICTSTGIEASTNNRGKIKLTGVQKIQGTSGISAKDCDVDIVFAGDAGQILASNTAISVEGSSFGSATLKVKGYGKLSGAYAIKATNSIVEYQAMNLSGGLELKNCMVNSIMSNDSGAVALDTTVYNLYKTKVNASINSTKSVIHDSLSETAFGYSSLSDSVLHANRSKIQQTLTPSNSHISLFRSTFQTLLTGTGSSILAGSPVSTTIIGSQSYSESTATAGLFASGGSAVIDATEKVSITAKQFEMNITTSLLQKAQISQKYEVGGSSITITQSDIVVSAGIVRI